MATSAASAVFWTGSLIVMQLSDNLGKVKENATTSQQPWQYWFLWRPPAKDFKTTRGVLSYSSLVMLGTSAIAPIMGLFLSGNSLRVAVGIFAALYAPKVVPEVIFGVRILLGKARLRDTPNPQEYQNCVLATLAVDCVFFVAILSVLACPSTIVLLGWSIFFLFAGYQCVITRYEIEQNPLAP